MAPAAISPIVKLQGAPPLIHGVYKAEKAIWRRKKKRYQSDPPTPPIESKNDLGRLGGRRTSLSNPTTEGSGDTPKTQLVWGVRTNLTSGAAKLSRMGDRKL